MSIRIEVAERFERWEAVRATVDAPAREQLHHACALCLRGCDVAGAKDLALVLLGFDREDAEAWAYLGHALEGLNDELGAIDALRMCLRLRPQNAPAAFALARLLAQRGDDARALSALERFDFGAARTSRAQGQSALEQSAQKLRQRLAANAERLPPSSAAKELS